MHPSIETSPKRARTYQFTTTPPCGPPRPAQAGVWGPPARAAQRARRAVNRRTPHGAARDWAVKRLPHPAAPLSFFPVALLGMDHVAMSGNQCGFRLDLSATGSPPPPIVTSPETREPVLSQVLAIGATVNVSRNRIASGIGDVALSCVTFAELMSSINLNHFTHETLHYSNVPANTPQVTFNQVLASRTSSPLVSALETFIRSGFLRLLRRRPGGVG